MRQRHYFAMLAALLAWSCARAAADASNASNAELLACTQVADDSTRLKCFDKQAAALIAARSQRGSSPAAVANGAAPPPAVKLTPEQKMGLPRGKIDALEAPPGAPPEPQIKDLTAAINSVSVDERNRQTYILDNGQVWRQAETKPSFTVRPGDTVHITPGRLGSFFMSVNVHAATRVSRVR